MRDKTKDLGVDFKGRQKIDPGSGKLVANVTTVDE